jgi:hypothetical protein
MPIDLQLARSLFRANNVIDECPSCKQPDWRFGKEIVTLPYAQDSATQTPAPAIHAIPTICNNCGYIRLFLSSED